MKSKKDATSDIVRKIIPIGGGLLRLGETVIIDKFIVKESNRKNPKVLFIPTASKDLPVYSSAFRQVYKKLGCEVKILRLFSRKKLSRKILEKLITNADIIYVGGGKYDVLFSTWKKHKIFPLIQLVYKQGTILAGLSAGCAIWYEYLLDNDKNKKPCLKKGLGILKGIAVPRYKVRDLFPMEIRKRKAKEIITAIEDRCAVIYFDEQIKGSIPVDKERAFTISSPYVKRRPVTLHLQSSR